MEVVDGAGGDGVSGMLDGDLVAECSREALLETADLLLGGVGLLFGSFHLDAQ